MTDEVGSLADELPYWGFVDDRTCLTMAGELVTISALSPMAVDGRSAEDLDTVCGRWQRMLSGLPEGMRVYWIVERRPPALPLPPVVSDIAGLAQRKRQAFLRERVQDLDVHVVWCYDPGLRQKASSRDGNWWRGYLAAWLRRRRAPHESVYLAEDVEQAVRRGAAQMATAAAQVADVTPMETLPAAGAAAVLYRLVNGGVGEWVKGMGTDAGVNWRLAGTDVAAEREVLHVGGEAIGVWSCAAPPATAAANALADLYGAVQAPMTVVLEWRPWSRDAARRKLKTAQRHYFSKRYSMVAHMQEKEGTSAAMEDAAATVEANRAAAALVELETEGVAYGGVSLSVAIRAGSAGRLEEWGAEVSRVFSGVDSKAIRETYGQLAVWFGRLPGQPKSRQPREVFVSAGLAAAMAPLFGPPRGENWCRHLDKPAMTVFETPAGTPYHYDLFGGRDVGHTLMLGSTGSGKSFTLNYLLIQAMQYGPRVLILDLGGSYRALTQFVGGSYLEVVPEEAIPLRPFSLEPGERTFQFLTAWVLRLLRIGGWGESSGDLSELRARIEDLYALPADRRSLGNLVRSLPKKMWPALSRWHGAGTWGKWFDNPPADDGGEDLQVADWQVIDLAGAAEQEDWCEAALFYLLERMRAEIEDPKELTRLKLMVVDEAWRYLKDPLVLGRLTEAARTWRKRNAALVVATQSVTDITTTPGAAPLLESMPTKLFLANPDFPASGQTTFDLSDDELRLIKKMQPKLELFVRRPSTAAVLRLNVDPESYWLYTSSATEAKRRAEAVEQYGLEGAIMRLAAGEDFSRKAVMG